MKEKILIVDDEKDIVKLLDYNLKKENFRTIAAYNGNKALELAGREHPDVVILDLMLPDVDGLEVCRMLKKDAKTSSIPIVMLTAKGQEADKIVGLELGADDYVTKPFSPRELIARIRAVLRRLKEKERLPEAFEAGDLMIDFSKIWVGVKGKPVDVTAKEFELLKALIKASGRVLSRDYLLNAIWGMDQSLEIQTRTVDAHITTLRKKLKGEARRIVTVKNYGYRFEIDDN